MTTTNLLLIFLILVVTGCDPTLGDDGCGFDGRCFNEQGQEFYNYGENEYGMVEEAF